MNIFNPYGVPDLFPLTKEERLQIYYRAFAGEFPAPNQAAIAAILAFRAVELEDEQ